MESFSPTSSSKTSSWKALIILAATGLFVASSQASIIYLTTNTTGQSIDFSYDSINSTIQIGSPPLTYGSLYTQWFGFAINYLGQGDSSLPGYSATDQLSFETVINESSSWNAQSSFGSLNDAYFGIRIDQGSGNYNYGWVQISTPETYVPGGDVTLTSIAFESTPNTMIGAGTVPEPSTAALLGVVGGATALVALRRKKI